MSRDVFTVGLTMRIPLLYQGEYSQWRERFMNYLEEQADGEAMINSIQNGDQPLPVIAQVSLAGTAQNAPPTLKDPKFWTDEEKKTRILSFIATKLLKTYGMLLKGRCVVLSMVNKIGKLQFYMSMRLAIEAEQLLDTYLRYLQQNQNDVNDALGYKKKAVVVTSDPLALVAEKTNAFNRRKFYSKPTKNNLRTSSTSQSANKKQEFFKSNDKKEVKKADEKKKDMSKVLLESNKSSSSAEETIAEDLQEKYDVLINQVNAFEEKNNEFNDQIKVLNEKNADLLAQMKVLKDHLQVKHVVIDTHVECHKKYAKLEAERYEYMIRDYALFDNDKQHRKHIADQEVLFDKMSVESVELDKHTVHMIMPSKDNMYNGRKGIGFENSSYFEKAKDLRPTLYDKKVISLGMCDVFDDNNLFIFDDESVRISLVSKMPFRKKPCDSLNIIQICLWIIDSGCSKHMTGNHALLTNFVEKFLGTVRFGKNDFAMIVGYGDVVIGSMMIKKVYYVEGLGHNLFSIGQFCDKGLEVAFRKSTCFVRKEEAKASSSQSWFWHQRLSHLNFATINNLVKNNLGQGLLKMKFEKDHLCSACEQGKIHRKHHKSKMAFASNKPLYLLHMDLCRTMRVQNEASEVIISFIKKTQVNLQLQVQHVCTDNGTEFKNKTLAKFFDEVGITQQSSAARTPQQNGIVEKRNQTLVEAAITMHTFANLPSFLWAEAIAAACFTKNRSIIHKRFDKTPYEIMNKRKPNKKFFRVLGCRCYLLNDYEDVRKLKAKGDIGVFVGYSKKSAAFRIYDNQTYNTPCFWVIDVVNKFAMYLLYFTHLL
nr:hypothetical protein [Tanacetum cinerariifolium]